MKTFLAVILIIICTCQAVIAGNADSITVAVEANWPPMEFVDEKGVITGFSVDYVNAVAREAGFTVSYVTVPWENIFKGLEDKEYDMVASSVSITAERKKRMAFSLPYYDVQQAVVMPVTSIVRSVEDLDRKKLGVQTDTTGDFAVKKIGQAEAIRFEEIGQAFAALEKGDLDGVVADDPVAISFILENRDRNTTMKVAFILPSDEPEMYGFAVLKGNLRLLDMLNRGIQKVQEKGIDGVLRRKWIGY